MTQRDCVGLFGCFCCSYYIYIGSVSWFLVIISVTSVTFGLWKGVHSVQTVTPDLLICVWLHLENTVLMALWFSVCNKRLVIHLQFLTQSTEGSHNVGVW